MSVNIQLFVEVPANRLKVREDVLGDCQLDVGGDRKERVRIVRPVSDEIALVSFYQHPDSELPEWIEGIDARLVNVKTVARISDPCTIYEIVPGEHVYCEHGGATAVASGSREVHGDVHGRLQASFVTAQMRIEIEAASLPASKGLFFQILRGTAAERPHGLSPRAFDERRLALAKAGVASVLPVGRPLEEDEDDEVW